MKAVRLTGDEESMEVTFERDDGTTLAVALATEAAVWMADADLLDSFGVVVVAATPADRHDPTYADRAAEFLSIHHAPAKVLATFET